MKFILSTVQRANVELVQESVRRSIWKWLLIYVWISKSDENLEITQLEQNIEKIVYKIQNLQVFADENDKIKKSLVSENLEILLISNFTLCAKNRKWNKMDFQDSAEYELSKRIYNKLIEKFKQKNVKIQTWEFWAKMLVESSNLWPLNYVLEI